MVKYPSDNALTQQEDSPAIDVDIEQQAGGLNSLEDLKPHGLRKYARFQWLKRNRITGVCLLSSKHLSIYAHHYSSAQENFVLQTPVTHGQSLLVCPLLTNRPVHAYLSNTLAGRNRSSPSSS